LLAPNGWRVAVEVAQRHEYLQRLVSIDPRVSPNKASSTSSGSFQPGVAPSRRASVLATPTAYNQISPLLQAARDVRLSVRAEAQACGKRIMSVFDRRTGGKRPGLAAWPANSEIKPLQPLGIGEIFLHRAIHTASASSSRLASQPPSMAISLSKKARPGRAKPHQFRPYCGSPGPAR